MLRGTVAASAVLAAAVVLAAGISGHLMLGIDVAAGLLVGSCNGFLILGAVSQGAPFVASSIVRLAFLSAVALLVALVIGGSAWAVILGVAGAQLVMVAVGVREGLRS